MDRQLRPERRREAGTANGLDGRVSVEPVVVRANALWLYLATLVRVWSRKFGYRPPHEADQPQPAAHKDRWVFIFVSEYQNLRAEIGEKYARAQQGKPSK